MATPADATRKHPGKVFVEASAVKAHLDEYRIVDCRYSLKILNFGSSEYVKAHLKGAVRADVDADLSEIVKSSTARHPLPPCDKFVAWCKSNGIGGALPVLCYDDESGAMGGCRLWWMLDSLGVEAYVINGGFSACCAAGLEMEAGTPSAPPAPVADWPHKTVFQHHYTIHEIPPNAILTDARAPLRFGSTVRPYGMDSLPGHIEGARNLPYGSHLVMHGDVLMLRDEEEIRSNLLKVLDGASSNAEAPDFSHCVFSCGSGLSAALNLALMRHLGLGQPYLYCGSWSEYSGLFRFPIMRSIINDHGMYMKMQSPCLADNAKADLSTMTLKVDGAPCASPDSEIKSAAAHLHAGESAIVYFKSGRVATIEVPMGGEVK